MGWKGSGSFETVCRVCGKKILMVKDRGRWHPVETATGNRHVCDPGRKEVPAAPVPRWKQLCEKEFLTKAEEKEYLALCESMKKLKNPGSSGSLSGR